MCGLHHCLVTKGVTGVSTHCHVCGAGVRTLVLIPRPPTLKSTLQRRLQQKGQGHTITSQNTITDASKTNLRPPLEQQRAVVNEVRVFLYLSTVMPPGGE